MNPGSIGFHLVWQTCPFMHALYAVPVRRAGTLPAGFIPFPDIRLPSDSASRRTPLPLANAPYCQARSGLSPPSCCPCRAHHQKTRCKLQRAVFMAINQSSMILVTTPEPTVRPPSRIAKRRPSSQAMGVIRVISMSMLSPGMTISTPSGSLMLPVTSVVRK